MKIVTDCASDLLPEEVSLHNISVAPLYIQFPEGEVDARTITPDEFYDRLRAMDPEIPTTSQPSSGFFAELYRELLKTGEDIMSVHVSSGLSGTIETARLGAAQITNSAVTFIDTLTLSGGERFQVLAAAMASKAGWQKEQIIERCKKIQAATETVYTLETLTYLARGGRIGRVQALAGALLKIKPVIDVDHQDGKYSTIGKERTIKRALEFIGEHLNKTYGSSTPLWVTVLHGQFQEQAEALAEILKQRVTPRKLELGRISPVLGVHTGPGIVGAAVVPMDLMEGW